ncbi:NAD(P)-dependent oxidoreductase, partial [bacterium DOLJORAL78_65_58]
MTILVTGSAGMLGQAVMRRLASAMDLVGVDLVDADLSRADAVAALLDAHPCR